MSEVEAVTFMEPTRKELLAYRLAEWPLVRVLIFNIWFRLLLVAIALVVVVCAVGLLKVWRTSPPDFLPVVHVSWVDLVQARMLRRNAEKLMAQGKYDASAVAWHMAVINNPADPSLIRGSLDQLLRADRINARILGLALDRASWLLRLTKRDPNDLELAVRAYDKYELNEAVLDLLGPVKGTLPPILEAAYLKALFLSDKMDEFGARWKQSASGLKDSPELALYHAAWEAGWGPPDTLTEGRTRLASAVNDPDQRILANRLLMFVSYRAQDLASFQGGLRRLEEWHADRVVDQIAHWELLVQAGKKAEARQLAENYALPPVLPWHVVGLAQAYASLGMEDYAKRFLRRYAPELGNAGGTWATRMWELYADLLITPRKWHEQIGRAFLVRVLDNTRVPLGAFSQFMEGRALYSLNRHAEAQRCFQRAAQLPFHSPAYALKVGNFLLQTGEAATAWQVLLPLQGDLPDNVLYWWTLFQAAYAKKDGEMLLKAGKRAYELAPNDGVHLNNYAAALLNNRERPTEALKLTLSLYLANADSVIAKMNHSIALAMNHREKEAQDILDQIDPRQLTLSESTDYYLTRLEIDSSMGQTDKVREDLEKVNTTFLFPAQIKWLEKVKARLPVRTEPAKSTNG